MNNIIEGMNVITKTPIKEAYWLPFWLLLIGGAIISIFGTYLWYKKENPKIILGKVFYFAGFIVMSTSIISVCLINKETGRYTYECTLEDNVSAKYISDNFNIINVEDNVWTITDK